GVTNEPRAGIRATLKIPTHLHPASPALLKMFPWLAGTVLAPNAKLEFGAYLKGAAATKLIKAARAGDPADPAFTARLQELFEHLLDDPNLTAEVRGTAGIE